MTYLLKIKTHPRSRKITLRVQHHNQSIVLTKPFYVSEKKAKEFLASHQPWVDQIIAQERDKQGLKTEGSLTEIPIFGQMYQIIHDSGRHQTKMIENCIYVYGMAEAIPSKLKVFLKSQIRVKVQELVDQKVKQIDRAYKEIQFKDTKSRWGSCSYVGNLNFSWRLVFMPDEVIDYIVAHEVAHLKYFHHQKDFWDLVDELTSHASYAKSWLKKNASTVFQYLK
ncbi:MAG: M48 family metallopeptidase [Alphaproteobacteria bacterium]|jgi:predicted metal-dependent hydrolase|nr:M48 family metallopeptidase [Alphaproteobacteria bacterium]MBP9878026.1 M48 family metallopeptidase [Alphaproteobacteria bacterium]